MPKSGQISKNLQMELSRFKVLFVCSGNICRSPLAHAVFEQLLERNAIPLQFFVESAGTHGYHTGEDADPRMRETAARHGFPFHHPAQQVWPGDLAKFDVIFAMDTGHLRQLRSMASTPEEAQKVRLFREFDPLNEGMPKLVGDAADVPDPYYGGREGFELVFEMVHRTSLKIIEAFQNNELP